MVAMLALFQNNWYVDLYLVDGTCCVNFHIILSVVNCNTVFVIAFVNRILTYILALVV